jgi:tryptophan halogenase
MGGGMNEAPSPRSVIVVGTPLAGCSAALAVRRALPRAEVSFLALPDKRRAFVETTGASGAAIRRFHEALGIDQGRLARAIAARTDRGTRLVDWTARGPRFIVRRSQEPAYADGVALHQLWLWLEQDGEAGLPPWDELGQHVPAAGLRFDPPRYHRALGEMLGGAKITVATPERLVAVPDGAGGIAAVQTPAGQRYEAELFFDLSGPQALLIGALDAPFDPWEELPALTLSGAAASKAGGLPFQQTAALGDTIIIDNGFSALRFDAREGADPCGVRRESWRGNVIALGEAATHVPPLAGMPYDVLHHDLLRLIELLPSGTGPALRREYLRRSGQMQAYWRDWAGAFWLHRGGAQAEGLKHVVAQFSGRGRVPVRDGDPVSRGEWIDLLIGMGLRPAHIDPTALVPTRAQAIEILMRAGSGATGATGATEE